MNAADDAEDEGFLRRVYGIDDPLAVRDYYDAWADSYDAELTKNGYASPARVAAALAGLAADLTAPVLDYGCGTGMSGVALISAGFCALDGADPSSRMLRAAEAKKIYRTLVHLDLDEERPPFTDGHYAIVSAIGLIGPGAAPLALFDQLLNLVAPGGLFGVSFNDHASAEPAFSAKIDQYRAAETASVVFEEHGPHLPGLGVESMVYVLRKGAT